jgi:hypothetical protein
VIDEPRHVPVVLGVNESVRINLHVIDWVILRILI